MHVVLTCTYMHVVLTCTYMHVVLTCTYMHVVLTCTYMHVSTYMYLHACSTINVYKTLQLYSHTNTLVATFNT